MVMMMTMMMMMMMRMRLGLKVNSDASWERWRKWCGDRGKGYDYVFGFFEGLWGRNEFAGKMLTRDRLVKLREVIEKVC